jgi:hypothetical protein
MIYLYGKSKKTLMWEFLGTFSKVEETWLVVNNYGQKNYAKFITSSHYVDLQVALC